MARENAKREAEIEELRARWELGIHGCRNLWGKSFKCSDPTLDRNTGKEILATIDLIISTM